MKAKDLTSKIRAIIEPRDRRTAYTLLAMITVMAGFEVCGIASVVPFMSIAADPGIVERNEWLQWAYRAGGFDSIHSFLIASGVLVVVLLLTANSFAVLAKWMQLRFSWTLAHRLSTRMLRSYAMNPYDFFLTRNSSQLGKQVLTEVQQFVNGLVLPATELCSRLVVVVAIFSLLILADPPVAFMAIAMLGGVYALIYVVFRGRLGRLGLIRAQTVSDRYNSAMELLRGIKLIKVHQTEDFFLGRFTRASALSSSVQTRFQLIGALPRYGVETFAFGGVVLFVVYLLSAGDSGRLIPMLSLYVLAGFRLLPSVQGIFSTSSSIRYNSFLVDEIWNDLRQSDRRMAEYSVGPPLPFSSSIELNAVVYSYPATDAQSVDVIDLQIAKGERVAFVGSTGSGKSTLVDLVVGLLSPTSGTLSVDGVTITQENARQWQANLGYVPQVPFFFDDTIARNIALGCSDERIDMDRIRRSARVAQVDAFIETELPDGYQTILGEAGVRISGGQRQRIALARALYNNPGLLVLDEATAALDALTERDVLTAIEGMSDDITILVTAHRLSSVKNCDRIYLISEGKVAACGTYAELMVSSQTFQAMVGALE